MHDLVIDMGISCASRLPLTSVLYFYKCISWHLYSRIPESHVAFRCFEVSMSVRVGNGWNTGENGKKSLF